MTADLRAEALALITRLDSACHQEVDCAIYDHPYVAELREASQLAAAALAARLTASPMQRRLVGKDIADARKEVFGDYPGSLPTSEDERAADFLNTRLAAPEGGQANDPR